MAVLQEDLLGASKQADGQGVAHPKGHPYAGKTTTAHTWLRDD